jgi:hypothetical protein
VPLRCLIEGVDERGLAAQLQAVSLTPTSPTASFDDGPRTLLGEATGLDAVR